MTFKKNWEKTDKQHQIPAGMAEKMVNLAYPNKKLSSYQIISGGCANLNIKIQLEGDRDPLILRIYLRDKDAAYREQNLGALLKQTVPIPISYYVGDFENYRFAITKFIPGITLRDLLLEESNYNLGSIMREVGLNLAKITSHEFSEAGFFDKNLNILKSPDTDDSSYLAFALRCLNNEIVKALLEPETIRKITAYFEQYQHLFPDSQARNLVHADFDPANILVNKINHDWHITGILDWEFSFSGSILCDVANMLRYTHHMPPLFEEAFLLGLYEAGISLPKDWRITVDLLNLTSLLDCLIRSNSKDQPNQYADILELINHILEKLDELKLF